VHVLVVNEIVAIRKTVVVLESDSLTTGVGSVPPSPAANE